MSDKRISDLTAYTDLINTDLVPVVDVTGEATKKVTISDLRTAVGPFVTVGASNADYICDGTPENNRLQIQAALNAVGDAGGGTVHLKAHSVPYEIDYNLRIPHYVCFEGDGWATVIKLADGALAAGETWPVIVADGARPIVSDYFTTYGYMIKDLKVDANRAGQSGLTANKLYGIMVHWSNNVRVENVFVINAHSSGIGVWPSNPASGDIPSETVITGCRFEGNGGTVNAQPTIDSGVFISDGTTGPVRVIVSDCISVGNSNGFCVEDCNGGVQLNNLIGCDNTGNGIKFSNGTGTVNGGFFYLNGGAGIGTDLALGGRRITLNGVQCRENEYGFYGYSAHGLIINGGHFWWNDEAGIYLDAYASSIVGAKIEGNGCGDSPTYPYGVYIKHNSQDHNYITGCSFETDWYSKKVAASQTHGIVESGACGNYYFDNIITVGNYGVKTAAISLGAGSGSQCKRNTGHITEKNGTGSITSGSTTDVITHGLSETPTAADIHITLTENPSNTPGAIWVDTIGATTFTVNCENNPGASNLDFSWQAIIL